MGRYSVTVTGSVKESIVKEGVPGVSARVRPGIEVLLAERREIVLGRRVGLITNHTGVDSVLRSTIDLLHGTSGVKLAALFGPEHGVRGDAQAGVNVSSEVDPRTGLPVRSLYGPTKKPTPEMLADIDVLVYDIQDIGVRYYTYIYTLAYCLEAAAEAGLKFVVLDRPAPLGGLMVEGNIHDDPGLASFVGGYGLAVRYGLTAGELATYYSQRLRARTGPEVDLVVVPAAGWRRSWWFDETGLPWVPPSPNTPALETAALYPGTCLIEGTNLSEGRGTTLPFQVVGAPWVDGWRMADTLNGLGLEGVLFRPTSFVPAFSKHQGERCGGVQVHLTDRRRARPLAIGLAVLVAARRLYASDFRWLEPARGRHFIDLLTGTRRVREGIDAGADAQDLLESWEPERARFAALARRFWLYPESGGSQEPAGDGGKTIG